MATCSMCGNSFSGRSDAVYCSPACRQKAHRARTARRTAELREHLRRSFVPVRAGADAARLLQRSVAVQQARAQVDRSRELRRVSRRRLQESGAIREDFLEKQAARVEWARSTKAVLWPGS